MMVKWLTIHVFELASFSFHMVFRKLISFQVGGNMSDRPEIF